MSWNEIVGHDAIKEKFRRAVANGRLASTFLFVGPAGIGKMAFAEKLAQSLLCEGERQDAFEACRTCPACQQVSGGTHPDLIRIAKPEDKNAIPVETFIGDREHRMQAGLCHEIGLKPFRGGRKIAIIDDADFLNAEGANCLLKTLEEPPPNSLLILIGTSEQRQLPTIRSRSQVIRFAPLSTDQVEQLLLAKQLAESADDAGRMAAFSGGSIRQALLLADADVNEFRTTWFQALASLDPGRNQFSKTLSTFVDAAGKDSALKRDRLRLICEWAHQFYRNLLLQIEAVPWSGDEVMLESVQAAQRKFSGSCQDIANCISRCLATFGHIAGNLNQATLIESLLSDLGQLSRGEVAVTASY